MRKTISFCVSLFLVTTALPVQAEFEHCVDVYQAATRNLQISEVSYNSLNTIFDDFCESSGEVKKSALSAGIEATIKNIPLKFSGSSGSSTDKMKNFCRSYSNVRFTSIAARKLENFVVVDALKSFNECIKITGQGIIVQYTPGDNINTAFSFQFKSTVMYELQGVQTGENITCTTQDPKNRQEVKLDRSSSFTYKKNFTAFCNRQAELQEVDGHEYYPRTSVIFASNYGNYSVIYPEEEIEAVQFATLLDRRMSGLEERLGDLTIAANENNKAITTALENKSKALQKENQALQTQLNNFRNTLGVKVYMLSRGQHRGKLNKDWTYIKCGNPESWIKAQCPNQEVKVTKVQDEKGDSCGYSYYVGTCIQK